jgi:hypothetical protein
MFNAVLVIAGLIVAGFTLADVFQTVVVPGESKASLRVSRRLTLLLLPLWKRVRGKRDGLSPTFAPTILVTSFVVWVALLGLGFGMMAYAARADFQPALESYWDAVYMVGSSLITIGLSETNATGPARWVILAAGFCGLAVITMAVTYLLEVQSNTSDRDVGILKLNTVAGQPPSALTMFEKFAAIGDRRELAGILREGRNWCANVRQSHSSRPSVIYFQSVGTGTGWPAGLGALLDAALIAEEWLAEEQLYGAAILLREEATAMAEELAKMTSLESIPSSEGKDELERAANRLRQSGYRMKGSIDFGWMDSERRRIQGFVNALADHLGKPRTTLLRDDAGGR